MRHFDDVNDYTLDNIVEVYENAERLYDNKSIDESVREYIYSTFEVLDNYPKGLPMMEDLIDDYENEAVDENGNLKIKDGEQAVCLARVKDLFSSPRYNRIRELRYGNQEKHLKQANGFLYAACGTLDGYYRPNQKKAVTTKGNNRGSKLYGVTRDPNARIPILLKFHPRNRSIQEIIRIESNDHNMDANYRTNQSGDHKFTSAYYAGENSAENLHSFLKVFDVGIADTLPGAKFYCPSHSYVSRARSIAPNKHTGDNDIYVSRFLRAFTERKCADDIQGNTIMSGTLFLKFFEKNIKDIDNLNSGIDSFADAIDWAFNNVANELKSINPNAKNITQEMIIAGSKEYKKHEPMVARWVNLYNTYCNRLKIKGNQENAIPLDSNKDIEDNTWNKFMISSNPLVQGSLYSTAKQGMKWM